MNKYLKEEEEKEKRVNYTEFFLARNRVKFREKGREWGAKGTTRSNQLHDAYIHIYISYTAVLRFRSFFLFFFSFVATHRITYYRTKDAVVFSNRDVRSSRLTQLRLSNSSTDRLSFSGRGGGGRKRKFTMFEDVRNLTEI